MPTVSTIVFYGLSALLIGSAITVVTMRNIFHSAMGLVAALSFVAGLFMLLGADFLAASQVLVYIGGIMIIMLFVIMLSQQALKAQQGQTNEQWFPAICFALVVGVSLIRAFRTFMNVLPESAEMIPTSSSIGRLLLGEMLLPFEAVSLVLLAALVGAVIFGQDREGPR